MTGRHQENYREDIAIFELVCAVLMPMITERNTFSEGFYTGPSAFYQEKRRKQLGNALHVQLRKGDLLDLY